MNPPANCGSSQLGVRPVVVPMDLLRALDPRDRAEYRDGSVSTGRGVAWMGRPVVLAAVAVVHLVVASIHGVVHSLVPVLLAPSLSLVVVATTFVGPVAGVVLAWRSNPLGAPLYAVSMGGAFLTGGVLHFVFESPDHVHAVPPGPWQGSFQATAVVLAATTAVGTVVGVSAWLAPARQDDDAEE